MYQKCILQHTILWLGALVQVPVVRVQVQVPVALVLVLVVFL